MSLALALTLSAQNRSAAKISTWDLRVGKPGNFCRIES